MPGPTMATAVYMVGYMVGYTVLAASQVVEALWAASTTAMAA